MLQRLELEQPATASGAVDQGFCHSGEFFDASGSDLEDSCFLVDDKAKVLQGCETLPIRLGPLAA